MTPRFLRSLAAGLLLAFACPAAAQGPTAIAIGYVQFAVRKSALSLVEVPAANDGVAGAELAIEDDNTTGHFLNQHFTLQTIRIAPDDNLAPAAERLVQSGTSLVIADLPADVLLTLADEVRPHGVLLFNVGTASDRLREEFCRANIVHVAPTHSMLADALAQYLAWKRWMRWLLVSGSHGDDKAFAAALRRAASRFGGKIVQERMFQDTGGARRTDSGIVQVQRQMPLLTQEAPAYDVLMAADESQVFAAYLPYRTWDARPVAGSAGLVPTSWDPSHDQWGAVQMQDRFSKKFGRRMSAVDMQAWTAGRMIGEAASRIGTADAKKMLDFFLGPDFALAAFKGQKLTLRDWNLQLRQPILLSDGRAVVSVSPQEGFLHPVSELDTLGIDRPESKCRLQ
jgi:ABC transporter substrate binding protein (PQQ-dependent alcohol dehydrogenase system)